MLDWQLLFYKLIISNYSDVVKRNSSEATDRLNSSQDKGSIRDLPAESIENEQWKSLYGRVQKKWSRSVFLWAFRKSGIRTKYVPQIYRNFIQSFE